MRASWRDPDDITPGARRTAKEITGFRAFCPLRQMSAHPHSGITAAHIMAADKLRELIDIATIGYSGDRPLIYVQQNAQPCTGMGRAALAQNKAWREVRRVVDIFPVSQLAMIQAVILQNVRLFTWARQHGQNPQIAKGRLLSILDRLVQHFEAEVEDDLARGRRLPP